jgi:hypothetical protein
VQEGKAAATALTACNGVGQDLGLDARIDGQELNTQERQPLHHSSPSVLAMHIYDDKQ